MTYDFDSANDRRGTASTKWDRYESRYQLTDVIPLWVADMDFNCLPEVTEAIIKRAEHGIFGYTDVADEVYQAIVDWESKHHQNQIEKTEIVMTTGVVYAIYSLVELLVKPQEKVIVQTPVYPPFFNTPKSLDRTVVYNPLLYDGSTWTMDYEDLENQLREDPSIRMMILCNPHNPVGRCWKYEELEKLCEICHKYHVWIVSDEIHGDLILKPNHQHSIFTMPKCYHEDLILLGSPTKTFNLAGLKISYAVIKNTELKEALEVQAKASGLSSINIFGLEAVNTAYRYGDKWLEECLDYIDHNFDFTISYLQEHLPEAKCIKPEATYMAWVDLRAMKLPDDTCEQLKFKGHVELQGGAGFGIGFEKWQRINLACPRATLEKGLKRLCDCLKEIEQK